MATEVNFDGLVGLTHNYGGLALGNTASIKNKLILSKPRQAALQGLDKMKFCHDLGLAQAVLPPHSRPNLNFLKQLGFTGSTEQILQQAEKESPALLVTSYSASAMWTANAATVSPSADTEDEKVHVTPANLISNLHRSLETPMTTKILNAIFHDRHYFHHHTPLPLQANYSDEGAANHGRLCLDYDSPGVELFVYGKHSLDEARALPRHFPARQTLDASEAIARLHLLQPSKTIFAHQHPRAIDQGVFHNDVLAVTNKSVIFYHENAYLQHDAVMDALQHALAPTELIRICVSNEQVPLADAVSSYLFNSQLVSINDGTMALIAPQEVADNRHTQAFVKQLLANNAQPIRHVHYVNCRQSMKNGGGPACLRLRVVLTKEEQAAINQCVLFTNDLYEKLFTWINKHYREKICYDDLLDPLLVEENYRALDELTQLLDLGCIYDFQQ